ncbi:MAG: DHA2 family efflux MFS transporter permease subunit [Baekduia sp.]
MSDRTASGLPVDYRPWPALWAMVIGFFMILVDATIVTVATPAIISGFDADVNTVIWVTSAYLLAYAVPLLVTGRLGDRVGPRTVYLAGLVLFTGSSLWCGLTGTIGELIVARVVQGLGAALMTPQTMAVITRTFPAEARGKAMALWGATAGVAMLVGPVLGGLLVDGPGWEWIFFINVPVGVIALLLGWRLIPRLDTHSHRFDPLGVALSTVGMFCLVFGIQEGEKYDWGQISGILSVPLLIGAGFVILGLFVFWQSRNRGEPLIPLSLFGNRNFSLANAAITTVSFAVTSMGFPFMLYAQLVRGMSPTEAGLLLVPMAVLAAVLAPFVGGLVDRVHPRLPTAIGLATCSAALVWLSLVTRPNSAVWELLLPMALLGVANAFMWAPLAATATRDLPPQSAGAGAGVYNATRQVGGVLGSAGIAALISSRLAAELPAGAGSGAELTAAGAGKLPPQIAQGFADAMAQSLLLPAAAVALGLVFALAFQDQTARR